MKFHFLSRPYIKTSYFTTPRENGRRSFVLKMTWLVVGGRVAACDWLPALSLPQVAAVSAFAQTLRRYTSLNHLAQAARAVLQNTSQINQMLSDLNRVDFANVQVRLAPRALVCPSVDTTRCSSQYCVPREVFCGKLAVWLGLPSLVPCH